jgi:hypothetical protein
LYISLARIPVPPYAGELFPFQSKAYLGFSSILFLSVDHWYAHSKFQATHPPNFGTGTGINILIQKGGYREEYPVRMVPYFLALVFLLIATEKCVN